MEQPRVLSRMTGRLRLHLPGIAESALLKLPGVREVKANSLVVWTAALAPVFEETVAWVPGQLVALKRIAP